ncbi:hypothetical protein L7F22_028548 [Adiantum nelumboides]|nr:hypothetical protein [Adiantum nelumboides]
MAQVEARKMELADARATKAAEITKPMTMEEARKIRKEIEEKRKLEAEQKAQEEAAQTTQAAQTKEKEIVDLSEALKRKVEKPILEPREGSPKKPRVENDEELENIQLDPTPPSPSTAAPPAQPPSSPQPSSSPKPPQSPKSPELSKSPPAPTSPQQQQDTAETTLVPPSSQLEDKQEEPAKDKEDQEVKQAEIAKPKPAGKALQIPLMQLAEPTQEEAYEKVKNFDYTKIILTLSRQFQCQKVVAQETDFQRVRAQYSYEEVENLRTALQMVTRERDSGARENENLLKDLLDVHSQLDRKETQSHELVKNKKKMKEQLKYEDARFQKISASYNTLTMLLQNEEPAATTASTSGVTMNTLIALQEELQIEKLQRQLLVSGFMTQTAQHEAKVKELEQELAEAKDELKIQRQRNEALSKEKEAVGSLALTTQTSQAETHLHVQLPHMPDMRDLSGTSQHDEEHQGPAPGALDVRGDSEQDIEDMPEGPSKEFLLHEKRVMEFATLAFLQPEEQAKGFGHDFLPVPLMRHKAILWKKKMRLALPRNEQGGYEGVSLTAEQAQALIEDHPKWRKKWLQDRPNDFTQFHNTSQALQIDPTYCPVPRRRTWQEFQRWKGRNKSLRNYPILTVQNPPTVPYVVNTLKQTVEMSQISRPRHRMPDDSEDCKDDCHLYTSVPVTLKMTIILELYFVKADKGYARISRILRQEDCLNPLIAIFERSFPFLLPQGFSKDLLSLRTSLDSDVSLLT